MFTFCKNDKYLQVPASKVWGFAAFLICKFGFWLLVTQNRCHRDIWQSKWLINLLIYRVNNHYSEPWLCFLDCHCVRPCLWSVQECRSSCLCVCVCIASREYAISPCSICRSLADKLRLRLITCENQACFRLKSGNLPACLPSLHMYPKWLRCTVTLYSLMCSMYVVCGRRNLKISPRFQCFDPWLLLSLFFGVGAAEAECDPNCLDLLDWQEKVIWAFSGNIS